MRAFCSKLQPCQDPVSGYVIFPAVCFLFYIYFLVFKCGRPTNLYACVLRADFNCKFYLAEDTGDCKTEHFETERRRFVDTVSVYSVVLLEKRGASTVQNLPGIYDASSKRAHAGAFLARDEQSIGRFGPSAIERMTICPARCTLHLSQSQLPQQQPVCTYCMQSAARWRRGDVSSIQ